MSRLHHVHTRACAHADASKTQGQAYADQPVGDRIADLRRIRAARESDCLAEERRAQNIDWPSKIGMVQRIESGHTQRECVMAARCSAKVRVTAAAQATPSRASNPPLRFRCRSFTDLAESGAGGQTIMNIEGHVSKQMLKHYSHIRMKVKRNALETMVQKRAASATEQNGSHVRAESPATAHDFEGGYT